MALQTPIPALFSDQLRELLPTEAEALLASLDEEASVSVRLNRRKTETPPASLPIGEAVPWAKPVGFYLDGRPAFAADPLWHAGVYYVQEASSMLLRLVAPLLGEEPLCALDLCAAPGGKSTLLLDLLPEGSTLVSNELVRSRAQILAENIQKWGGVHSVVTSTEPQRLGRLREQFDFILVDAPCSGEGMFRKEEEARRQWTPGLVESCARQQREILDDIWPALAPGGLMVYSTCTFNRQEDEDMISYLIEELGAEPVALPELPEPITPSSLSPYPCYRMMPHRLRGEGLFMAVVRKPDAEVGSARSKPTRSKSKPNPKLPQEVLRWLSPELRADVTLQSLPDGTLTAIPSALYPIVEALQGAKIPILTSGIPLAEVKGRDFLPLPALALSVGLDEEAFPRAELAQEEAIRYLAREAVTLSADTPRGLVLVTYEGYPLGFAKHLGNRTNNLYPQAWRIRHPELLLSGLDAKE